MSFRPGLVIVMAAQRLFDLPARLSPAPPSSAAPSRVQIPGRIRCSTSRLVHRCSCKVPAFPALLSCPLNCPISGCDVGTVAPSIMARDIPITVGRSPAVGGTGQYPLSCYRKVCSKNYSCGSLMRNANSTDFLKRAYDRHGARAPVYSEWVLTTCVMVAGGPVPFQTKIVFTIQDCFSYEFEDDRHPSARRSRSRSARRHHALDIANSISPRLAAAAVVARLTPVTGRADGGIRRQTAKIG